MPRRPRIDFPGAWHHITNRGVTHRAMFERREDVRFFLARLAWMVHQGKLEVHAFSILTTHFHLLVRSPEGDVSTAMCRVQSEYSARFNRRRGRDGPLVRSRFASRLVRSDVYRDNVIRYIDANAVEAGLVAKPHWHRSSSAYWYGSGRRAPRWLERSWIEQRLEEQTGCKGFDPAAYRDYYEPKLSPGHADWIERRLAAGEGAPDPLDDLIDLAPPKVLDWLRRNAARADGQWTGTPVLPVSLLEAGCVASIEELRAWRDNRRPSRGQPAPVEVVARAGLLHDLGALSLHEIAQRLELSRSGALGLVRRHRTLLRTNEWYSAIIGRTVHFSLQLL